CARGDSPHWYFDIW
nr:immunoglobulin heavy chain junction region [Macaca mulatta]MOX91625.1 immunoglobulin heavy chain junction region [Macaca mulatta]MOX91711.1 immunoglobulin heavy chain junction region [Macaca mulatta]MOX91717.1 immunoglobulin heavy chain junction region [Macaca mulatta]MOX91722.1 immunoglobulin heavy chain junction region [Macaca mulatta]